MAWSKGSGHVDPERIFWLLAGLASWGMALAVALLIEHVLGRF